MFDPGVLPVEVFLGVAVGRIHGDTLHRAEDASALRRNQRRLPRLVRTTVDCTRPPRERLPSNALIQSNPAINLRRHTRERISPGSSR